MPYQISWYREPYIMLIQLEGKMSVEEMQTLIQDSFEHVRNASNAVHAMIDPSKLESIPMNLQGFKAMVKGNHHTNQGMTVFIAPTMNPMFKFISTTMFQMMRWEYRICDNYSQAETIIRKVDSHLPER